VPQGVQSIKRPTILSKSEATVSKTADAYYVRPLKQTAILPKTVERGADYVENVSVHEQTHAWQGAAKPSTVQEGYKGLKGLLGDKTLFEGRGHTPSYLKYLNGPEEVHARFMQVRHLLGFRADEVITAKRLVDAVNSKKVNPGRLTGLTDSPEDIELTIRLLNRLPASAPVVAGAGVGILGLNAAKKKQQ
jgi:hypothetical protein